MNPSSIKNNIQEEYGSDSSENDNKNSSYDSLNENFNYDYLEININDFSVTSQHNYVTFDYLYLLSRDNDDTEEVITPIDFIKSENSGDI